MPLQIEQKEEASEKGTMGKGTTRKGNARKKTTGKV
jgi:hypothetical protein